MRWGCRPARSPGCSDYGELADDIAVEARVALQLTQEIHELDERIKLMLDRRDPAGS
jgi:hypothetical protein